MIFDWPAQHLSVWCCVTDYSAFFPGPQPTLHGNLKYWSVSTTHPWYMSLSSIFPPLTFCPSMPRNSGSAANVRSAPLSPTCQARGHRHHSLLPSVIEKLSQRSSGVFTLTADLCGREHAMSRRIVSNLNTTLQRSWLWPMYGASVYPAPINWLVPGEAEPSPCQAALGLNWDRARWKTSNLLIIWQRIPGTD